MKNKELEKLHDLKLHSFLFITRKQNEETISTLKRIKLEPFLTPYKKLTQIYLILACKCFLKNS